MPIRQTDSADVAWIKNNLPAGYGRDRVKHIWSIQDTETYEVLVDDRAIVLPAPMIRTDEGIAFILLHLP